MPWPLHVRRGRRRGDDLAARRPGPRHRHRRRLCCFLDSGSGADRVRHAAAIALELAQDEFAEITTDPWPRKGAGVLPTPRAEFISDGTAVRLLYGELENPLLELDPLQVSEILSKPSS